MVGNASVASLIWATLIGCTVCYYINTLTVDSSTKPFQSRIVLKKEFLKYTGDYSSPSYQIPSKSGVEWRFRYERERFEQSKRNIELELLFLPKDISHVIVSVNCTFESKPNASDVIIPTTENWFLVPTHRGPLRLATFWSVSDVTEVSMECHIEGLLGVSDITEENVDSKWRIKDCGDKIKSFQSASESLPPNLKISMNMVILKAGGHKVPVHRFILRQRAPNLIPITPSASGHYEFDFGEEINGMELEALVRFMKFGYDGGLESRETCDKLVSIATKYKIDCLDAYCRQMKRLK